MRPWTVIFLNASKRKFEVMELSGPMDPSEAWDHVNTKLPKNCEIASIVPGCHASSALLNVAPNCLEPIFTSQPA